MLVFEVPIRYCVRRLGKEVGVAPGVTHEGADSILWPTSRVWRKVVRSVPHCLLSKRALFWLPNPHSSSDVQFWLQGLH